MYYIRIVLCFLCVAWLSTKAEPFIGTRRHNLVQTLLDAKPKPVSKLVESSLHVGAQQCNNCYVKRQVTIPPTTAEVATSSWWESSVSVIGSIAKVFIDPFVKVFQTISEWIGLENFLTSTLPEFIVTYLPIDFIASILSPGDWTDWNAYP